MTPILKQGEDLRQKKLTISTMSLTVIFQKIVHLALLLHIVTGFGSIVLFWLPIFSEKGGKTHRKFGKIYILLMWLVIFSGIVLTISKFHEGEMEAGIFLGFLVFLAARPVWYGIAILKSKNTLSTRLKNYHITLKLTLFFYGIFMLIYALKIPDLALAPLFIAFGVLGFFAGLDAWRDFRNTSTDSKWLKEHFEGMLISGVAAYTGFLAIGGYEFINKYMVGNWVLIPWLLPSVVGMSLIIFYRKRFSK